MKLSPSLVTLPLALAACDAAPTVPGAGTIHVVPATPAEQPLATLPAPAAPPAPGAHRPQLSVAETAQINTSEMWSEPIAADAEPIEIE